MFDQALSQAKNDRELCKLSNMIDSAAPRRSQCSDDGKGLMTDQEAGAHRAGRPASGVPDIIGSIRDRYPALRPAEQAVADAVLSDVEAAVAASNAEIAARAGVSEPTVTRFCRAVGCDGVRDFKLQLARSLAVGDAFLAGRRSGPGRGRHAAVLDLGPGRGAGGDPRGRAAAGPRGRHRCRGPPRRVAGGW